MADSNLSIALKVLPLSPSKKRPSQPDSRTFDPSSGTPKILGLPVEMMRELLHTLTEAGAPKEVIETAAEVQNLAANGDIGPLLDFLASIGFAPDQAVAVDDHEDWDPPEDLQDVFPMSNQMAAAALLAGESADRSHKAEIKFLESVRAMDPESVETLIAIGMESQDDADTVKYFHQACEIAKRRVEESHDLVPDLIEYRNQMGIELVERARLVDAVEILLPAIEEDERDGAGTRFLIIDLMLRIGWWDELGALLDRFPDGDIGPGPMARAILLNHVEANSDAAIEALKAAHRSNQHLAPVLISSHPLPADGPRSYSVGSREEALILARYLKPGLRANPGTTHWIRETLDISADEHSDFPELQYAGDPISPGDLDGALAAPLVDEVWTYHGQKVSDGKYQSLVVCEGALVGVTEFEASPKSAALRQLILDTVCEPITGVSRRPSKIIVANKTTLTVLQKAVGTYGVGCEMVKPSAAEKKVLKELSESTARGGKEMMMSEQFDWTEFDIGQLSPSQSPWLMAVLSPPLWIGDGSTPYRPHMQLVVDGENGKVLKSEISESFPPAERQAAVIADAMLHPSFGSPRCPREIVLHPQTDPSVFAAAMQELASFDDAAIVSGDETIARIFEEMILEMLRPSDPIGIAMIEQEGVDSELLDQLYRAASRFYQIAPWNLIGGDQVIRVVSGATPGHDWGACVMGQLGETLGLSMIDGVEAAQAMIRDEVGMMDLSAISIQFGEAFDATPLEFWQMETRGYEVANQEAYPLLMKIEAGGRPHLLNAGEIRMVIEVMNQLPAFLQQGRRVKAVEHGVGTASQLEMAWVDG